MAARSGAVLCLLVLLFGCRGPERLPLDAAEWTAYKDRFIAAEGRVVDTGNGGVSHTEGQGFGMLLAVAYDDRATFNALWAWTRSHLAMPGRALFAWRWRPGATPAVADPNNATDGDLLIAWALLRGGRQWGDRDLTAAGLAHAAAILALERTVPQGRILLPGADGFTRAAGPLANLSYAIFPAYAAIAAAGGADDWREIAATARTLLGAARFGADALPPDWLQIDAKSGVLAPAAGYPPRFGYDAVRIPLYLVWAGAPADALAPFAAFWRGFAPDKLPAWVDLTNGAVSPESASTGLRAIVAATAGAAASELPAPAALPQLISGDDYYSASLLLLAKLAVAERRRDLRIAWR